MSSPIVWCQNHDDFYENEGDGAVDLEDTENNHGGLQNNTRPKCSSCCHSGRVVVRYRNPIWSCLLVVFGCVAMSTKALKYRHEGATVSHNLAVGFNLLEDTLFFESNGAVPRGSGVQALWHRLHPNITASSSSDWIKILDKREMNGELSLREMTFNHNKFSMHEYEVIMNRIWPPLMVVVCTLSSRDLFRLLLLPFLSLSVGFPFSFRDFSLRMSRGFCSVADSSKPSFKASSFLSQNCRSKGAY